MSSGYNMSGGAAKGATAPAFLEKLYEILTDQTNSPYIAWQPDGQAFLIKKVPELQEIVLPKYFKHNNLQSFVRQLNMYNFAKTCHDPNYREFRNTHFIKGRRDLLSLIKRKAQSSVRDSAATAAALPPPPSSGSNSSSSGNICAGSRKAVQHYTHSNRGNTTGGGMDVEQDAPTSGAVEEAHVSGQRSSTRKRTSTYKAIQGGFGSNEATGATGGHSYRLSQPDYVSNEYDHADDESAQDRFGHGSSHFQGTMFSDHAMYVAQQSSDLAAMQATAEDLRWRVRQLETTNTLLMERYTGLASKHDELCQFVHAALTAQQQQPTVELDRRSVTTRGGSGSGSGGVNSSSRSVSSQEVTTAMEGVLKCRIQWGDITENRRRRAYSDMAVTDSDSVIAGAVEGSFDSTGSRFMDTDSEGAQSDGLSRDRGSPEEERGIAKAAAVATSGSSGSFGGIINDGSSGNLTTTRWSPPANASSPLVAEDVIAEMDKQGEAGGISIVDICDSPTYHAANILVRGIQSSKSGPTPDNGLKSFVDAISTMWQGNSDNHTSLNKHTQLSHRACGSSGSNNDNGIKNSLNSSNGSSSIAIGNSSSTLKNVHGVSIQTAASAPPGPITQKDQGAFASTLTSPIKIPKVQTRAIQSPHAADCGVGVGGGYGCLGGAPMRLAGQPMSKQVSLSSYLDPGKKQKVAHAVTHGSDDEIGRRDAGFAEGEGDFREEALHPGKPRKNSI